MELYQNDETMSSGMQAGPGSLAPLEKDERRKKA
jgi:hypothetical protein